MSQEVEKLALGDAVTHLLEECRMVLPGVQALFGFQLIAVFNAGFGDKLTGAEQRLHLVAVWRDAPLFTHRERAALAWTEALTLLPQTGAPDEVYEDMANEFDPSERVALTLAVIAINGWNRLAVGFRQPVGEYVSHRQVELQAAQ